MNVSQYRMLAQNIVDHYIDGIVEIVPDVASWCEGNAIEGPREGEGISPIAMCVYGSSGEPARILLQEHIDSVRISSQVDALSLRGFDDASVAGLHDDAMFVKHLVLHEIAHVKNGWGQDKEVACDEWAFRELTRWG